MKCWIVVVDDEALSLTNAKTLLNEQDMRVSCLRSGQDLLKFMAKNEPDLILLDILMPEMDGFETYQALRQMEEETGRKKTPVIFLTGSDDSETERRGLKVGASDFIRKPFNREILIRRIYNTVLNAKMIKSLTEEAAIDKLTGFLNKAAGTKRISKLCETETGALMVLDLDNFKLVNDLHGHEMGDRVLKALAEVIRRNARTEDVAARIGGDEFMLFCRGMTDENGVTTLTQRLNEQMLKEAAELIGEGFDIPLGISVGAAMAPVHGKDYETLFSLADGALYRAKRNGKHGALVYHPEADSGDSGEGDPKKELARITKIVEERNEAGGAFLLGMEQFSFIYRFVKRFGMRYGGKAVKLLFVLSGKDGDGAQSQKIGDVAAKFGLCLQDTLRRSDIMLQSKPNQFFLFLPQLSEEDFPKVLQRIMAAWKAREPHSKVSIDYAVEYVVYEKKIYDHGEEPKP
jgi:diguanylate cyclase (GGDEF)-like protein